jgi:2-oxoglutarate dehydrogenase complex dehydrogenase (E1) component-like enzyme
VYETMQLMRVQDFSVGGSIHVVVNNQVRLLAVIAAAVNHTSSGFSVSKQMYSYQTANSSICLHLST